MNASLQDFVRDVNGESHLRVERDFGDGFVRLQTSEAERRQAAQDIRCSEDIVLEMLRNSRDAHASHIFVAMSREGDKRLLTIIDDGCGIPESMHALIFEPRVTSKLDTSHMDEWGMHGRGMALYSISVNADSAQVVASDVGKGSAFAVTCNIRTLGEKKDQSTFPTFELADGGTVNVRGPKNILRTICEFAIASRSTCSVFVGSPAEIASTLYAFGQATMSSIDRLFCQDVSEIPIAKRLATTGDPESFAEMAESMGISISDRTARRVLDGQISDVEAVLDQITITGKQKETPSSKRKKQGAIDARSFKLGYQDALQLGSVVKDAFSDIADRYYLEDDVEPSVRVRRDRIVITIPVVKRP